MPVLCKFAYELTLGLLHSCSPNVKKKKKKVIEWLNLACFLLFFFFQMLFFYPFFHLYMWEKKSFGQAEIHVWSQPECCGNELKGRNIFKHCMVCS